MLNSGKKFALCTIKKGNMLTLCVVRKKILNKTKNHNSPCKLNGRSLIDLRFRFAIIMKEC